MIVSNWQRANLYCFYVIAKISLIICFAEHLLNRYLPFQLNIYPTTRFHLEIASSFFHYWPNGAVPASKEALHRFRQEDILSLAAR
jgi:hypothetical protein